MPSVSFEDYHGVTTTVYRFAFALDTHDWDLMRTLFDDQVHVDVDEVNPKGSGTLSGERFVWQVKLQETGFEGTQLMLTNPIVTVDGDEASVIVHFYGEHIYATVDGEPWYTIGGYQEFKLRRRGDGWVIHGFALHPLWTKGNKAIMALGTQRGYERLVARGDPPPDGLIESFEYS